MPEKPPFPSSFEEFQKQQERMRQEQERFRSLEGMKKHGRPEQRRRATELLNKYSKEKD